MAKKVGATKNCHYVAQSLTKPWEVSEKHRDRILRFYDFNTDKVDKKPSKSLLSKYELLTPEEDARFGALIETPLGKFKNGKFKESYIDDYSIFRALFLYFIFQGERFSLNAGILNKGWTIKELLALDEQTLNTFTESMRDKYVVRAINPPDGHLIFHSSVGYFTFPVICQMDQSCVWGLAVPLFPNLVLTIVPIGPTIKDIILAKNVLMKFSVGLNKNYDKIIIPAELEYVSDQEISQWINESRFDASKMEKDFIHLDYLARLMFSKVGLNYDEYMTQKRKKKIT